MSRFSKTRN